MDILKCIDFLEKNKINGNQFIYLMTLYAGDAALLVRFFQGQAKKTYDYKSGKKVINVTNIRGISEPEVEDLEIKGFIRNSEYDKEYSTFYAVLTSKGQSLLDEFLGFKTIMAEEFIDKYPSVLATSNGKFPIKSFNSAEKDYIISEYSKHVSEEVHNKLMSILDDVVDSTGATEMTGFTKIVNFVTSKGWIHIMNSYKPVTVYD